MSVSVAGARHGVARCVRDCARPAARPAGTIRRPSAPPRRRRGATPRPRATPRRRAAATPRDRRRAARSAAPGAVHRRVVGPRPAAEAGALVVGERLLQLGAAVHHERPVLRDRLADRTALQQQQLARLVAVDDRDVAIGDELERGVRRDRLAVDRHRPAREEVQAAARAVAGRGRQRPARAGRHADRPDRDVGVGARSPRRGRRRERRDVGRADRRSRRRRSRGPRRRRTCDAGRPRPTAS